MSKAFIQLQIIFYAVVIMITSVADAQTLKSAVNIATDSLSLSENEIGFYHQQLDLKDIGKDLFQIRHRAALKESVDSGFVVQPLSNSIIQAENDVIKPGKILFAIFPAVGYTIQTGATAIVAMNLSFLNGKGDSTNLSTIAVNPAMSLQYNQYLLPVISNIWSKKNKFDFVGDWRYYKYPTYTYGIGGHTSTADADLVDYSYIRIYQQALKQIASSKFYTGLGYNFDYHFGIAEQGDVKGTDFQIYNGNTQTTVSQGCHII